MKLVRATHILSGTVATVTLVAVVWLCRDWQTPSQSAAPSPPPPPVVELRQVRPETGEQIAGDLVLRARSAWIEGGLDTQAADELARDAQEILASLFLNDYDRYASLLSSKGATLSDRGAVRADAIHEFLGPGELGDERWRQLSGDERFRAAWLRNSERGAVFEQVDAEGSGAGVGRYSRPMRNGLRLSGVVSAFDSPVSPFAMAEGAPPPSQTAWIEFPAVIGHGDPVLTRVEFGLAADGVWYPIRLEVRGPGDTPMPLF